MAIDPLELPQEAVEVRHHRLATHYLERGHLAYQEVEDRWPGAVPLWASLSPEEKMAWAHMSMSLDLLTTKENEGIRAMEFLLTQLSHDELQREGLLILRAELS